MPRLIKMLVMGVMPLLLAVVCCCSASSLSDVAVSWLDDLFDDPAIPMQTTVTQPLEITPSPSKSQSLATVTLEIFTPTPRPTATFTPTESPSAVLLAERYVTYDVVQSILLTTEGRGKATDINMNVALIRSISPYQVVVSREITPPQYTILTDDYGNEYAYFIIDELDLDEQLIIEISYVVDVYEIRSVLGACQGDLPETDLQSERYIEVNDPIVVQLKDDLIAGKTTVCDQVLTFYDYLVDNMTYAGYNPGEKGAMEALRTLEGDCTEFSDSMVALSRAAGIPARFLEGVVCCTTNGYADGKHKHNWLEVYLPELGWTPMDPTWAQQPMERNLYFAGITPDHIIVTVGRNLERLGGYHYFYYTYNRESAETRVTWQEEWSILIR